MLRRLQPSRPRIIGATVALSRLRGLSWKLPLAILAAVAIAASAEAWHAAWNSCTALTNFGEPSVAVCFHPGGLGGVPVFWLPDFLVLLGASLVLLIPLLLLWELLSWRFRERIAFVAAKWPENRRRHSGWGGVIGVVVPLVAFGGSFLGRPLLPLGFGTDLADPWSGIWLLILLTIPSAGAVFALVTAARLSVLGFGSPLIAATGAFVGSLLGYLPSGLYLLPVVMAPPLSHAAYVLSYLGDRRASLSRRGATVHLAVSSVTFVPIASFVSVELLFLPLITIYAILVAAIVISLQPRDEHHARDQGV